MSVLFDPIKAQANVTDRVVVAFSGGKDSCVTLDLCCRYFKKVSAFFMYQVPNLSFQEAAIRYAENRYGIEIERIPHFELSEFLRYGAFRKHDLSVPLVKINDVYQYQRVTTGTYWIAAGERIADSIVRRAMMKKSGCIDTVRGRFYPIANFTKADVVRYIEHHKLKPSPESRLLGHSFRSLHPDDIRKIKEHYPNDYEKVVRVFPFIEAGLFNHEEN